MFVAVLAAALCVASFDLAPARAEAQCAMPSPTCSQVTPDAKGMIGLGLIGLELGFVIPALVQEAAGTNEWWPYLVFPAVGAIGGIVGGYFMEQETRNSPEIDVIFLAVGMALVVPTLVATLALTAYDPAQDAVSVGEEGGADPTFEDETTTEAVQVEGEFGDEPAPGEATTPAESTPAETAPPADEGGSTSIRRRVQGLLAGGPGILRFDGHRRQLLLGVPMVHRRATFTAAETDALNLGPQTDVHIPVVSATF
ncbi:MAG: hypothetical protein M3Y87_21760 [Myxococcota bacterium]|nr:hypothetical protein [Myxococcota bacterium]